MAFARELIKGKFDFSTYILLYPDPTTTQVYRDVIAKLEGLDTGSAEFETMFTEFSAKVHQHAASEEAEVLPLLKGATTLEQRQAMGEAFLASQAGIPSHR